MSTTWNKRTQALMFLSTFIELGKYHFYIMSGKALYYKTDNVLAKCFESQNGKGMCRAQKMHVCVGWYVK
jgi:hypothetical protein